MSEIAEESTEHNPQQGALPVFTLERGEDIEQVFQNLKVLEVQPADRSELITIVGFDKHTPEFSHLLSIGADSEGLKSGKIARGLLLDAGYVFLNRIGGGEKPLINAKLPMDFEGEVQVIDFGSRVLLTQAELDAVLKHQKSQPELFASENIGLDLVRKDMLFFLQEAFVEQNNLRQKSTAVFREAQRRVLDNSKYTDDDREALRQFFKKQYEGRQTTAYSNLGFIMQECLSGIDLAMARGISFEIFAKRLEALKGDPSTFLDSGFHFDTNYDVTLYPHDPSQTRRLNMVVIHLLSRGLNEMGDSTNQSHDQRYITAGEYERDILHRVEKDVSTVSDEILDSIAHRLLVRARAET